MARKKVNRRGNNESTIYQRSDDKRWCGQVFLGYRADGKADRRTVSGKTREEVAKKITELQNSANQGIPLVQDTGSLTVAEFLTNWAWNYKKEELSTVSNTFEWYLSHINKHIIPALGKIKLKNLTTDNMQALLRRMSNDGLTRTVGAVRDTLIQALGHAVDNKLIAYNPALATKLPKKSERDASSGDAGMKVMLPKGKKSKAFSLKERELILAVAEKEPDYRALIILLMFTGLRIGEALALPWRNINLETGIITIDRAIVVRSEYDENNNKTKTETVIAQPKSNSAYRSFKMPKIVIDTLRCWKEIQSQKIRTRKCPWESAEELTAPDAPVFYSKRSWTNYTYDGCRASFLRVWKRHNLDSHGITFHRFRHTFATMMFENGVHPKTVQALLGHSKVETTMDVYTHVMPEVLLQAAGVGDEIYAAISDGTYAPKVTVDDDTVITMVPNLVAEATEGP